MRKTVRTLCALALCLGAFSVSAAPTSNSSATVVPLDSIVAVVNNEPIMLTELNTAIRDDRLQLQAMHQQPPAAKIMRAQVLKHLIDLKMQMQLAKRNHITVSNEEVNQAIGRIARSNHLTVQQFMQRLASSGISVTHYRQQMRQQLIIFKVQQQIAAGKVNVTDAEVNAFLATQSSAHSVMAYRIRDVLLATNTAKQNKSALTKAVTLRKKLMRSPKNSSALLKQSGAIVNVMSARPVAAYPDVFMKPLKGLKLKQWSQPIVAGNGVHLLQLLSKKQEATKNSISKVQARNLLMQQKAGGIVNKWLGTLRDTAYIKIMPS